MCLKALRRSVNKILLSKVYSFKMVKTKKKSSRARVDQPVNRTTNLGGSVTVCSAVHRPNYSLHVHMSQNFTELGGTLGTLVVPDFGTGIVSALSRAANSPTPSVVYRSPTWFGRPRASTAQQQRA